LYTTGVSRFSQGRFLISAAAAGQFPADLGVEVAFAGRSNAGKSSAINTLAQRHRLAFVSKTPGRTQQINFFSMGGGRFLVDLPGYGYAKVPRDLQREWERLISGYLQLRPQLRGLVVVMDIRHPMKDLDAQLLAWFATTGKPAHVLLTKSDKLGKQAATAQLRSTAEILKRDFAGVTVQLFSASARVGVDEAEAVLRRWYEAA
jgi:GTP-binding protein